MSALATTKPVEVMEDDRIGELLEQRKGHPTPWFSFEFFPPKTPEGVEKLYERLAEMAPYNPLFVDFTWGAGGSTAELTLELTIEARRRFGLIANMHLTCTNMPTEKVVDALKSAKDAGITNILALRGGKCHIFLLTSGGDYYVFFFKGLHSSVLILILTPPCTFECRPSCRAGTMGTY